MGLQKIASREAGNQPAANPPKISNQLLDLAREEPAAVIKQLESRESGLINQDAPWQIPYMLARN